MGTSIRFLAPLVSVFLSLFMIGVLTAGGGKIFIKSSDVPRASKTPKGVSLVTAQNSERAFSVRAAIAEIRLDQESSKGSAGMTGRLNVFRKFVRFDIRGVTPVAQLANLKVYYSIKEGDNVKTMEDSVRITTGAAAFIVNMDGFEDKFGTEVKSKSSRSKITSTKYIHDEADIVALKVVITDKSGHSLYVAGWPEAPLETIILPERLRPRTFTSLDGRKIEATIATKGKDTVTLLINGKSFKMELSELSEPDREFLSSIPSVVMIPQAPTTRKTADAVTLLGKTITYPHERRPDFMIRVQFKKDAEATFIGLGNHQVRWTYERGDDPSVYFYWSHQQGATKERGGYRVEINPDGKTATVSKAAGNYSVKAKIIPSR